MAGKVLIGGTAYTIAGGRACVGGTAYSISGGKTLIGGTAYSILFQPKAYTFADLLSRMTIVSIVGKNSSTKGEVQMTIPSDGTYFMFVIGGGNGHMAIHKVVKAGSISTTRLKNTSANFDNLYVVDSTHVKYMGESGVYTVYGATMVLVQFKSYTVAEAQTILSGIDISYCGGRESSGANTVYITRAYCVNKLLVVATNNQVAFSLVGSTINDITVIIGTNTENPSLVKPGGGTNTLYLSLNGTSNASVYGGTFAAITNS